MTDMPNPRGFFPVELRTVIQAYLAGTLTADEAADRIVSQVRRLNKATPSTESFEEAAALYERLKAEYEAEMLPDLVLLDAPDSDPAREKALARLNEALNRRYSEGAS